VQETETAALRETRAEASARSESGGPATVGEQALLPDWRTKAPPRGGAGDGKGIREIWASPLGGKSRQRFAAFRCR